MDLTLDRIDGLIVRFVGDDDRAGDSLVAAGPASLRRLIDVLAGRADPGWDALGAEEERFGRGEFERLDQLEHLLAARFPDALFDAVAADPALEPAVMSMLRSVEDPRAVPILERGLLRGSQARWAALLGLTVHGTAAQTEAVVDCLDDADDLVRSAAFDVLGRLGDGRAVGPLLSRLSDADDLTTRRAAEALDRIEQRLGGPQAPPLWHELGPAEVIAPSPLFGGPMRVTELHVEPGRTVRAGELLATLENHHVLVELTAPQSGTVTDVRVSVGDQVPDGIVAFVLQTRRRLG